MENSFELFETFKLTESRKTFEEWLEDVVKEMKTMFDRTKKDIVLLTDYEFTLQIVDEREEFFKELQEEGPITEKDFEHEVENIYQSFGKTLERYSSINFNFIGDDEDLIKKHINFSIHENSITKYYNSFAFHKTSNRSTSVYQAALYCHETFINWLEKRVNLHQ